MSNLKDICFDCENPWPLAHWWAEVLGYRVRPHSAEDLEALRAQGVDGPEADPYLAVDPIDEAGPTFWFLRVPESKVAKNRVHIDVFADVDRLVSRGARVIKQHPNWTVMSDPEGNEFCAFAPRA